MPVSEAAIRTAKRVDRFTYAIRNIVVEAKKVEKTGLTVRYLNIGDPNQFGFLTPPHLIEAVAKAMRDGHNGYTPSPGIAPAREAAAADFASRGVNVDADRVLITSGTSEGIELALTAIVDEGDEVLVPSPTYPLYTAVLAKIGAEPQYYRTDHTNHWLPDLADLRSRITAKTRVLVVIDPNTPTGAIYPDHVRRELIDIAEQHGLVILADEVYDKVLYDGVKHTAIGSLSDDVLTLTFNSLSKSYRSCGYRAGWMVVSGDKKAAADYIEGLTMLSNMRLCANVPGQ
jgi:alanine-synthesizing transaminase